MNRVRRPTYGPGQLSHAAVLRGALLPLVVAVIAACNVGCPPVDDGSIPFLDEDGNFTFDNATALPLSTNELEFAGEISAAGDIDLFDLGTLDPGDRLMVDVQRSGGDLDAVAVVFDSRELLHFFNDDREADASDLNPLIDDVIRGPSGAYFLGIAALVDSGPTATGPYRVAVRITRNVGVPDPAGQVVFLEWRGGSNVNVPNVGSFDLEPFDAAALGQSSAATQRIKDEVERFVIEAYQGFDLTVLNSDEDAEPDAPHTTVYFFGGDNELSKRAFAISEQIDSFNHDASDESIVFTRAYRMAFGGSPTVTEIAHALGNTVAHEIGHLLGLVHTADCGDLMDTTCSNDRLLDAQEFRTAPLDDSVFRVGLQDSLELLTWTLGIVS